MSPGHVFERHQKDSLTLFCNLLEIYMDKMAVMVQIMQNVAEESFLVLLKATGFQGREQGLAAFSND